MFNDFRFDMGLEPPDLFSTKNRKNGSRAHPTEGL